MGKPIVPPHAPIGSHQGNDTNGPGWTPGPFPYCVRLGIPCQVRASTYRLPILSQVRTSTYRAPTFS
jgi:hypothetical protein